MKKTDYKWFYQADFLEDSLHNQLVESLSLGFKSGLFIDEEGTVTETQGNVVSNRYHDNSILKSKVSKDTLLAIELIENKLIESGVKVPVLFNLSTLVGPRPTPDMKSYGWHKDFNIIEHIQDPLKLWFTMLTLTKNDVNSEFMVSPTPEGPDFWKMGVRTVATSNKLFGHNMHLGHEYAPKENNNVCILYMRWFDAG